MGSAARPTPDPPTPTEAEVVERARAGDQDAFRVLVERYQGRVFRLALRVLRDEEQARDVVQEAFLKVYRSLDRFEGRSSFYTWLYRLAMNLCLDAKRRDRSALHVEWTEERGDDGPRPDLTPERSQAPEASGPGVELERAELRSQLISAIEGLPDDARRTILLREVDGLSYAAIAKVLGVPKGTVMSRLHYARRRLREALAGAGALDETRIAEGKA